jgi:VIT1/CCC1 family predicted Fe2+/Mn2+ transporter
MIPVRKYSLGSTAAITTSMGLIAGLSHGAGARASIIASLLIVAVADNITDTLSLHMYKESECVEKCEVVSDTYSNFVARLLVAMTFVALVIFLSPHLAVICATVWGLALLTLVSYSIARANKTKPGTDIVWHLLVAALVIVVSTLLGDFISGHVS